MKPAQFREEIKTENRKIKKKKRSNVICYSVVFAFFRMHFYDLGRRLGYIPYAICPLVFKLKIWEGIPSISRGKTRNLIFVAGLNENCFEKTFRIETMLITICYSKGTMAPRVNYDSFYYYIPSEFPRISNILFCQEPKPDANNLLSITEAPLLLFNVISIIFECFHSNQTPPLNFTLLFI